MESLITRLPKPITLRSLAIFGRQCRLAQTLPSLALPAVASADAKRTLRDPIVGSVPPLSSLVHSYASLLSRELPCRMAHQSRTLAALPIKLQELPAAHRMNERLHHAINRISSFHGAATILSPAGSSSDDSDTINAEPNTRSTHIENGMDIGAFTNALTEEIEGIERDHRRLLNAVGNAVMEHEDKNAIRSGDATPSAIGQAFLDTSFQSLIALRMLYNHHQYGMSLLNNNRSDETWHTFGSSIAQPCSLASIVANTVEEARGLCTEKFSVAPDVEIVQSGIDPVILAIPSSVHYVLMETLKNSFRATIQRYGELDVHKAPPVTITIDAYTTHAGATINDGSDNNGHRRRKEVSVIGSDGDESEPNSALNMDTKNNTNNASNDIDLRLWNTLREQGAGHASVSIQDHGVGLSPVERFRVWQWMYTTAPRVDEESGYTYSRRFGAPFTGQGVGLPTARQYARSLGGELFIRSSGTAEGATATATFERRGITPSVL